MKNSQHSTFRIPYFSSGETILEVIIAVSVLMLIMAPASALYISSTQNIATNRNELIGAILAEEGVDNLRGMVYTNFLRFASKAAPCWNTQPTHTDLANCELTDNKISAGFYRLNFDLNTHDFTLEPHAELNGEPYDLRGVDDNYYQLLLDGATNIYNYTVGSSTNFYRQIEIQYLDLDEIAAANPPDEEGMRVISTVLYRIGNRVHQISTATILKNQHD